MPQRESTKIFGSVGIDVLRADSSHWIVTLSEAKGRASHQRDSSLRSE